MYYVYRCSYGDVEFFGRAPTLREARRLAEREVGPSEWEWETLRRLGRDIPSLSDIVTVEEYGEDESHWVIVGRRKGG